MKYKVHKMVDIPKLMWKPTKTKGTKYCIAYTLYISYIRQPIHF